MRSKANIHEECENSHLYSSCVCEAERDNLFYCMEMCLSPSASSRIGRKGCRVSGGGEGGGCLDENIILWVTIPIFSWDDLGRGLNADLLGIVECVHT